MRRLTRPSGMGSKMPRNRCRPHRWHHLRVSFQLHDGSAIGRRSSASASSRRAPLSTSRSCRRARMRRASSALMVRPNCSATSRWGRSADSTAPPLSATELAGDAAHAPTPESGLVDRATRRDRRFAIWAVCLHWRDPSDVVVGRHALARNDDRRCDKSLSTNDQNPRTT